MPACSARGPDLPCRAVSRVLVKAGRHDRAVFFSPAPYLHTFCAGRRADPHSKMVLSAASMETVATHFVVQRANADVEEFCRFLAVVVAR